MPTKNPDSVTFTGPAGEITIPLAKDMVEALPPMWQVRLEDTITAFRRGEIGDAEFSMRLGALFTNHPDVPGNQRLDPRMLDRAGLTTDTIRGLVEAGAAIMPYLVNDEGGGSGNAKN